jgi:hypothetical protein
VLHAKGGKYAPYYADVELAVNWASDGRELKADILEYRELHGWGYHWTAELKSHSYYFRPGLTWSRRTQKGLSIRAMPEGCIFADKGPAIFVKEDREDALLALLAVTNSSAFRYLVELQMAFGSYEVGVLQRTPLPGFTSEDKEMLASLAALAHKLQWNLNAAEETSHAFMLPAVLSRRAAGFDSKSIMEEFEGVQRRIDLLTFELYRVSADDRAEIESAIARGTPPVSGQMVEAEEDEEADGEGETGAAPGDSTAQLISWLVGVAFGRFDVRLATGERAIPPTPEPFDRLPVRSPGMWPVDEERPVPPPDILVDDPGHSDDISSLVSAGAALIDWPEPEGLRLWLAREFFPLHIRMYSKSRRKAPIYWQLATPPASYSVWLYIHAFSGDTLFRVQNDYLVPKLRHEENKLEALNREAGDKATAAQRRAIADQDAFVDELRGFLGEVKRVAPLWAPDLDDGVIINFAPLWRLVPHHRPWQKELKATWDALCSGKYDWSHLAMRLWPERVVPKCATDRSLAIAHGLEDVFWGQLRDKWVSRSVPADTVDELVAERTSDAVKAALRSLLDAPDGTPGRSGRGRAARARGSRGGR